MSKPKVFGIGFHKTGLTSLGAAFDILGYKTCHRAGPVREHLGDQQMMETLNDQNFDPVFEIAEEFEAFHDNPWFSIYKELDHRFPGSKFILSLRNTNSWLKSVKGYFGNTETAFRLWVYGKGSPIGNEKHYLDTYQRHNEGVLDYFKDRPQDLLVIDLEAGDGWAKLCDFLGEPIPTTVFPHENKGKQKRRLLPKIATALLLCSSTLVGLVLAELGAKVYIEQFASIAQLRLYGTSEQLKKKGYDPLFQYDPNIGYIPTPNYQKDLNQHNNLGFRGEEIIQPKPNNEFRIVCLGASTTYTTEVKNFKQSYPHQLQERLHQAGYSQTKVINAGAGGYSTLETRNSFKRRVMPLHPDMVIIYHGTNDVNARFIWPPEAYRGDYSGFRIPVHKEKSNKQQPWLSHFNLGRIILFNWSGYTINNLENSMMTKPSTAYGNELIRQHNNKTYPSGLFTEVSPDSMLFVNSPIFFQNNLQEVIDSCRLHNIKVLLLSFAWLPFENNLKSSLPIYQRAMMEHNTILADLAEINDLPFYDFANNFPKNSQLYVDGIHLNEKGSQEKARLIAEFITKEQLIASPF